MFSRKEQSRCAQRRPDDAGNSGADDVQAARCNLAEASQLMLAGVQLSYAGRDSVFNAIVEPDRESALIGDIVLEDIDLIVDRTRQTLAPRDPDRIVSEIE